MNYKVSNLSTEELKLIKKLEEQLENKYILIAYEKESTQHDQNE